ncbi:hypothetical protein ACFL2H_10765 [Planctomycetota bacterium]
MKPLLNAFVTGQDTVQTVVKGDRVYWFWGDTGRLEHPLGQFNTSGAISILPRTGVLTPWYDYNQIMYRLDLGDPRLLPAVGPPLMDSDSE